MNIKQAVSTILSKYGLTLEDEVKTEMGEAVLEDGTKVYCSGNFGVGETCYVVNEEGEQIALPDGEYKLQDGATFTIEEGKISASTVKQEEAPAEEKTETKGASVNPPAAPAAHSAVRGRVPAIFVL